MAAQEPSPFIRNANRLMVQLLRWGLPMGRMALLTVPGRNTGLSRTTPVTLTRYQDGWSLGSPFGETDWVRNLRAAGLAEITRRRRTIRVAVTELPPDQAAPLLMETLSGAGPLVRRVLGRYFAVTANASPAEWVEEARHHPMFILEAVRGRP